MFSSGQWLFALFFLISFVIAMLIAYRKDKNLHDQFYKGSSKILIGFLVFIAILFFIKIVFKH